MRPSATLVLAVCLLDAASSFAALDVPWQLNPSQPCVSDEVSLVFRGFLPYGTLGGSFYYVYRDSFVGAAREGADLVVVRTVFRESKPRVSDGGFAGIPVALGRLPPGPQTFNVHHHLLVEHSDGTLDSTVTESQLDVTVASECPQPITVSRLPWVSYVITEPAEPCVWRPLTVTIGGRLTDECHRVLSSAVGDSSHAEVTIRRYPTFPFAGCFQNAPPWNARFALGLPGPGLHQVEIQMTARGTNFRWPPIPDVRYRTTVEIAVTPTCGSLPPPGVLPHVTSITTGRGSNCLTTDMPQPGDSIRVSMAGTFANGCQRVKRIDLLPSPFAGTTPEPPLVRLVVDEGGCSDESCLESQTQWCANTVLPPLPAGKYGLVTQLIYENCLDQVAIGESTSMPVLLTVTQNPLSSGNEEQDSPNVGVDPPRSGPDRGLSVSSGRPNPFSDHTRFSVTVPTAGPLRVSVHDLSGRLVAQPFAGVASAGTHLYSWDGRLTDGRDAGSGIYFYRVVTAEASAGGKLVLMRER